MDTSIPEIYTDLHMLSLHASLPISSSSVPASPTTASPPTSAGAISRAASCASGKWTNRFGGNTLKRRDQEPEPTNPPERKPGDPPQPLRPPEEKGPRPAYSNPAFIESPSRSEEHTSELQSLMRTSYAVFCLKKKNQKSTN